jgi:hypothetical protein
MVRETRTTAGCVILIQLFYFLTMLKRLRLLFLSAIIIIHIGIGATFNLFYFSSIMFILNISALYNFKNDFE